MYILYYHAITGIYGSDRRLKMIIKVYNFEVRCVDEKTFSCGDKNRRQGDVPLFCCFRLKHWNIYDFINLFLNLE